MSRTPAAFKHSDVVRAVKALHAAGLTIERTEITRDGRIVLVHKAEAAPASADAALEEWGAKRNARSA